MTSHHTSSLTPDSNKASAHNHHYATLIRNGRKQKGLSQQILAQKLGVSKNTIGHWESGRARPDLDLISLLCATLEISLHEFFGIPNSAQKPTKTDRSFLHSYRKLTATNKILLESLLSTLLSLQNNSKTPIPKLRRLWHNEEKSAAGLGNPLSQHRSGHYVYLYDSPLVNQADEIVAISGDSMEPTYHNGDSVLIEYTTSLRPGEIGVFVARGEGYIKEYRPDGLYSHNKDYPTLYFADDDNVRCVGRVLSVLSTDQFATQEEIEEYLEFDKTIANKYEDS